MRTPIAICVLAAVLVAAPGRPRVVNLSDGSRYIGRVVENECTDELLVMTELRSGAKRSIPWSAVRSDEARTLRIELGFEVEEGEASKLRMDGHRIVNKAGTIFEGMLTNEETWKKDGTCILKTSEGMRKIRVGDIRDGPTSIQIDKLQVFTPEELYEREVKENPPETAEQHFQQAERCRIYGALAQAKEHYEACLAKEDPKYTRTKIQRLIDKVDRRLASAEADGELKEIKKEHLQKITTLHGEENDKHAKREGELQRKLKALKGTCQDLQELHRVAGPAAFKQGCGTFRLNANDPHLRTN